MTSSAAPSATTASSREGLFSIATLQVPQDFLTQAHAAMAHCNRLRAGTTAAAPLSLSQLDEISRVVCNVVDAAELCRSVHVDPAWRHAAEDCFSLLADYISQLNKDPALYQSLLQATPVTEEERRFVALLKAEFERDGIQINDPTKREWVRSLQNKITSAETAFSRNIVTSQKEFLVEENASEVTRIIPQHILNDFGIDPPNADGIRLSGNAHILQTLLRYSTSASLRKQVYIESTTSVPENLSILRDELLPLRRELAHTLGFSSYAGRFLQETMAGSPAHVHRFLQQQSQLNQPSFQRDMNLLSQVKLRLEGNGQIEPWDIPHYVHLVKAGAGWDEHGISKYLTLDNCYNAMQVLVERLFGIQMVEKEMSITERWDIHPGDESSSSSSLRRFDFYDGQDATCLGTMYLDLHSRPGKYNHAAHFTVRCGCLVDDENYQLPIIALVCNISEVNLSHSEVETLFHEFGHALHSLLSRTRFQHMSGTRAAMDFVETPSHLLEHFVWDKTFLKILAVNPATGEPLPDDKISALQRSRRELSSIEKQNQILHAMFDQQLHGDTAVDPLVVFADLHQKLRVPYAPSTHWFTRFGHLVSYGAGYYAYMYSQAFAQSIWNDILERDCLHREAGMRIWKELLIHGGAKDPNDMLTTLLGRPPVS